MRGGDRFQLANHDLRLQSLRGLAALVVLLGHASLICLPSAYSIAMGVLFEQDSAVIFFYVLSGFVLAAKLRRERFELGKWAVDRATRLLPVFWASIIFAALIAAVMRNPPITGASSWFNDNFLNIDLSARALTANSLALSTTISGTLWSVQVELWAAAFLPPLVFLIDRLPLRHNLLLLVGFCTVTHGLLLPLAMQGPSLLLRPLGYVYCFYLGALLPYAMAHERWQDFLSRGSPVIAGLVIVVALKLGTIFGAVSFSTKYLIDAIVSAQFIAFVAGRVGTPVDRTLLWAPIVRLGDISYSFYAIGTATLVLCAFFLFTIVPPQAYMHPLGAFFFSVVSAIAALVIALPVANLSHRVLEIALRRRLTAAFATRSILAAAATPRHSAQASSQ